MRLPFGELRSLNVSQSGVIHLTSHRARPERLADPILDDLLPVAGPTMRPILEVADAYARTRDVLLIRGPTGTGKSALAHWAHHRSPAADGVFVSANLHNEPDGLQESALFGSRRGAYTSSDQDRPGRLAEADGGTLFIDEIDKLPRATQARLLTFLDTGRYREIGGGVERKANVRVIVGTNADLERAVRAGTFLEDLYFRVDILSVHLPCLERRMDEFDDWARYFLARSHEERVGEGAAVISGLALDWWRTCAWPGNLRQLNAAVRRAHILATPRGGRASRWLIDLEHAQAARPCRDEHASTPPGASGSALEQLAFELVARARGRKQEGAEPLSVRDLEGLAGIVLSAAVRSADGDLREALELFGMKAQFRGGNHLKAYRREIERGRALLARLGWEAPPWLGPED